MREEERRTALDQLGDAFAEGTQPVDRLQLTLLREGPEVDEVDGPRDERRYVGERSTYDARIRTALGEVRDVRVVAVQVRDLRVQHLDGQRRHVRAPNRLRSVCCTGLPVSSALCTLCRLNTTSIPSSSTRSAASGSAITVTM